MTDRVVALTAYPLSHAFRERLEAEEGRRVEVLSVPQLRRLGAGGLLATVRRVRGARCLVALEDPSSAPMLPVLQAVAATLLPSSLEVVGADGSRSRVSRRLALAAGFAVAPATLSGTRARRAAERRLARLLAEPRAAFRLRGRTRTASVNANLWFGVKAGGSLAHTGGVANALAGAGYAVDLFAPFELPHLAPGVTAHPSPRLQSFALPSELNYFRHDDAVVRAVQEAAASAPPDFVYHRLSVHSHAGVRLSRALGAPLVLEYNGSEVWVAQHWGHRLRYERAAVAAEEALLRHAHVVVTISDVLRDELLERGVERERVVAYPNCVDPELFDPDRYGAADRSRIRERHGIAPDALVVTFVGTFGRWHGTEVLAQAIRRLESEDAAWLRERRLHFLLVGDGLRMPEVESALGGRRGAFHTLTGLVPQADAPAYLAASDIVVSPHVPNTDGSRFFGSPTKLFEYMAMALPIVASELDQLGQVLRPAARVADLAAEPPGDAVAVVVAPGDEAELAQALRRLADRPGWRERLGSNARRLALERYTWDAHVRAILDRLEAVCG